MWGFAGSMPTQHQFVGKDADPLEHAFEMETERKKRTDVARIDASLQLAHEVRPPTVLECPEVWSL